MIEKEFIQKHIDYVFKNWDVNFEDLDQDIEIDYDETALYKSVEDVIYDYYSEDVINILNNIINDTNLLFSNDLTVVEKLNSIDVKTLDNRSKEIVNFLKEEYIPNSKKCCWDIINDNFFEVLESLRQDDIKKSLS